jgi:diguanylate cyclase (GGDEF)-like protein
MAPLPKASGPPPRILVADDDRMALVVMASALKGEFEMVPALNGDEALAAASTGVDLVLLDVLMPGLDGFEVCRRLKSNPATAPIPVIFVTALEDTVEEERGFALGGVDYITKPVRPPIVRARVRTHIELKRAHDLLEQLASVDPLTGVANRRRFDAAIADEWRRTLRSRRWLSIALVDVDHFKQFNDRYGHLVGDACLQEVAASLIKSARRAGDLVARYGGEEFGLILPDVNPAMMQGILRALLRGASERSEGPGAAAPHELVTVSVGAISVVPTRGQAANQALAVADRLLYEAKSGGRARAVHVDLSTGEKVVVAIPASVRS